MLKRFLCNEKCGLFVDSREEANSTDSKQKDQCFPISID